MTKFLFLAFANNSAVNANGVILLKLSCTVLVFANEKCSPHPTVQLNVKYPFYW